LGEHKGETAVSAIEVDKCMERMKLERLCGHSIISRLDHKARLQKGYALNHKWSKSAKAADLVFTSRESTT
jgi:hypothetical protein